jgi:hypothetical protein
LPALEERENKAVNNPAEAHIVSQVMDVELYANALS